MPDDPNKIGKGDDQRINLNQAHEVAYWTKTLRVTENQLRAAVQKVGPMVRDVKAELGK
jgi:hypothetical protein